MARILSILAGVLLLAACATEPQIGPDGRPLPQVYKIRAADTDDITFRMLDSVNALRQAAGVQPVQLDANLTAAAATHALDMSVQNRPWNFGSDGSSPLERVQRAGFQGEFVGETIRETYETELLTLAVWMEQPARRAIILDPRATHMGFSWHQESNGKIWWTMEMGQRTSASLIN